MNVRHGWFAAAALALAALSACRSTPSGLDADQVRSLTRAERADDAIEVGRAAAKRSPRDVSLKVALGEAYMAAARFDEAVDVLTDAAMLAPENAAAQADLGIARYQKALEKIDSGAQATIVGGLFNDAATALERSLAIQPGNVEPEYYLGLVRFQQFRFDDARAAFERVLALQPDSSTTALTYFQLGEVASAEGRTPDAAEAYRRAVAAYPGYEAAAQKLGEALAAQGDVAAADKALVDGLHANPNSEALYGQLWAVYAREKRWDDLVAAYDRVAADQPGNAKVQWYRGSALAVKGDEAGAREAFEKCIVLDPTLPMPFVELARLEAKQGQIDAAVAHFLRAREIENGLGVSYDESPARTGFSAVAIQLFGGGKQDDAIALTRKLAEAERNDALLWSNLGLFYRDSGRYEDSLAAYEKAVALAPEDGQLLNDIGVVLDYHLNRPKEALEYYGRAIEASDHDETYGNLVRHYVVAKDFDKAIEIGEKGLSLYPDNLFIKRWLEVAKQGKSGANLDEIYAMGGASGGGGPALRGAPSIDDVAKELKLEGEKKDKVAGILEGYNRRLLEAYQQEQADRDWQAFRAKVDVLRRTLETQLGETLTADEMKSYSARWPATRPGAGRSRSAQDGH